MPTEYVSIKVGYRFVEGYHIFTSPDVRGLHVASRDPRKAYDSVAEVLQELISRKNGPVVKIAPALTFEEWLDRRHGSQRTEPILRERDFVIQLAAA
jgi:hypothetical protein